MDFKISDYAIVCKSLQILCKRLDCDFIDLKIKFSSDSQQPTIDNDTILLQNQNTIIDTYSMIFSIYINNLDKICGRNIDNIDFRNAITNYFVAMVRDFVIEYNAKTTRSNDVLTQKLDQYHVSWMLLKNIICPYKKIQLQNIHVVAQNSAIHDVAKIVEVKNKKCILVNLDIEKDSVRSAFVLMESLRFMLEKEKNNSTEQSAESIIRDMIGNYFMRDRIIDFLSLAYNNDNEVANFLGVLAVLCQSQELENLAFALKKQVKTAQTNPYVGNWWFMGLHEKMLEAVRGADYSTTINLKDFSKELWDKVEKERKVRGLSELPFEMMLRIQSEDKTVNPTQTLQSLLSKVRIW
jgi:hypothetical protein